MSLLDSLSISSGALAAQSYGSKVTSNNIANVNTPGYSRQTALLTTNPSPLLGVQATGVQRNVDTILGARLNQQSGALADANARQSYATAVQSTLDPNGDGGLSTSLDNFFSSFNALEADPTDNATRQSAVAAATSLGDDVRTQATALKQQQGEVDGDLVSTVSQANGLLSTVASLNAAIGAATGNDTAVANLSDQRDQALQQLSSLVGATAVIDTRGQATVSIGGVGMVMGDTARQLSATADATTGLHHITVNAPTSIDLDGRLSPSKATGLITMRDTEIQGRIDDLNQFASDFTTAVNAVHGGNYGLDGSTGNNLFTLGTSGDATTFAVDPNVTATKLAVSSSATATGNSDGASAMVALQNSLAANGGTQTFQQQVSASITAAGITVQTATSDVSTEQAKYDQVNEAAQSVSGVSLDEEDISLEQYQRAYQAAAKVVTTVDDMLQTLINMKQ